MRKLMVWVGFLWLGGALVSCDPNGGLEKINDFDQAPFLQNIGENIILPAYENLALETTRLAESVQGLRANPNAETLGAAQEQLKTARIAFQACTPYQLGPAQTFDLTNELNIYPVDQSQIEANIESGQYDLSTLSNLDARGFPAVEYLLHSGFDEELLENLTSERLTYLSDLMARMVTVVDQVLAGWEPDGGNYLGQFTSESALGVDVGSSTGQLINAMNLDFERNTRDGKIGIPVGIRSLGQAIPERSEAYFAGYSLELLQANMEAYQLLFSGGSEGGIGFDDYLRAIGASTTGNEDLAETIESQFQKIDAAIAVIADPLPDAIANQKTEVERIFAEMQVLVVLFKTDMASSLGVIITYQDNDGD